MYRTLVALTLGLTAAAPAYAADVFGLWKTENQNAIVEVSPCGDSACGKIVWLAEPNREDGSAKLDRNNPDPALQSRPICGMPMIGDFANGGDEWTGGFIYDPEGGDTYKSKMRLTSEGNLYVRGYVGIPLLGKSQVWTPVSDNQGGC